MLSVKKKIIYTLFTSPFAYITFKAYKWQTRRKAEKIIEIESREERLKEAPVLVDLNNVNLVNDEWEFKPVMLQGSFNTNYILINKTKEAEPGYHIVSPFKLQNNSVQNEGKNNSYSLIVDRGWVPYNYDVQSFTSGNNSDFITGVFYKGDQHKTFANTSSEEDAVKNKLFYMNPEIISNHFKIEGISKIYIFKIIDFDPSKRNVYYPIKMKKEDLMVWTIPPQRHQDYANFWITTTVLNVVSNIIVWYFL